MARHPLHPALVHFPVACWPLGVAADIAGAFRADFAGPWAAGFFVIGCVMAIPAMLAGLMELPVIAEGPALSATWAHMGAMLTAFCCFGARLVLGVNALQPLPADSVSFTLDALGFAALGLGGWLGGRLVYEHGIGAAHAGGLPSERE